VCGGLRYTPPFPPSAHLYRFTEDYSHLLTDDSTVPKYYLPTDVFHCIANDRVVFLDLRNNAYVAVEPPSIGHPPSLSDALIEAPTSPLPTTEYAARISSVMQSLVNRGLLTTDPLGAKEAKFISIERPTKTLLPRALLLANCVASNGWLKPSYLFAFWRAVALAASTLKVMSMWRIVDHAKRRRTSRIRKEHPFREESAVELISVYYRLRPYLIIGSDSCLFDSLALLNFLASFLLFPQWVFGVQMAPFVAHCWLQHEDVVLNDTPSRVCSYVPIMSV
jgi:Transglutaminase-like superfamily